MSALVEDNTRDEAYEDPLDLMNDIERLKQDILWNKWVLVKMNFFPGL